MSAKIQLGFLSMVVGKDVSPLVVSLSNHVGGLSTTMIE
jgi:hypothetical protein